MIQPNDLRIGNIIWDDVCNELHGNGFKIKSLSETIAHYTSLIKSDFGKFNSGVAYINAKGVLITPEILENFGFKKWGRDDMPRTVSYELAGKIHIFPANSFCDFEGFGFLHYKLSNFENNKDESARFKFKYLHQLQNIYYLATSEELIYKNETND